MHFCPWWCESVPQFPRRTHHPLLLPSSTLISLSLSLLSLSSLGDSELYSLGCLSVSWQADGWVLEGLRRDFCGSVWEYRGGYLEWTLRNLQSCAKKVWLTAAEPIQITNRRVVNVERKNCKRRSVKGKVCNFWITSDSKKNWKNKDCFKYGIAIGWSNRSKLSKWKLRNIWENDGKGCWDTT